MDPANLIAFLEVARTGSFSQAAAHLHLTQPAVSKRISVLESALGVSLFDRVGRRVGLTEAGRELLPRAQQLLADIEEIRRAVGNLSGPLGGTLKVGTSHHIGLHRLPPVLRSFASRYPGVKLDLRFVDSEQAYEAVLAAELELGVVTLPPVADERLIARPIWRDPLVFVAGTEHALGRQKRTTLSELAGYPALLPGAGTFTRQIVKRLFQEAGLELQASMTTNYLETLKMMASVGLGWSVLPATMLDASVVRLDVEGLQLQRTLGVVYHPRRMLSRAARAMLELLPAPS